jgi:hypothetical protein
MDRVTEMRRTRTVALLSAACASAALASGCGGDDDFENEPRPAVPLQLTGVITEERVTVSPRTLAPGPVVLIVSNQTDEAHTIRLEGPQVEERIGPVNPGDTGTLQATFVETSGTEGYTTHANPAREGARNPEDLISPATISIRAKPANVCEELERQNRADPQCRGSSSDELLLP